MRTFVAITGGLDSTYLLWKLLTQTSDEITAVNFDTSNTERRIFQKYDVRVLNGAITDMNESDKVIQIVDWLQNNVRQFTFSKEPLSTLYMDRDINMPNNPASYLARYAVNKINNNEIDRVCYSHEWENDGYGNGGTVGRNRKQGVWTALDFFKASATRGKIEFTLLDMDYNQAYALAEMPKDLLKLVLYPVRSEEFKNRKTSWFKNQLNQGKTPAEAGVIAKDKCTLPDGKWHSMKYWIMGYEPTDQTIWDMPTWPSSYEVPSSGSP